MKNLDRLTRTLTALVGSLSILCLVREARSADVPCIDALDVIFESESNVTDDDILRTYVLCPETTYTVAAMFDNNGSAIEGGQPLAIARSNIHVLCGLNGSSSNNCILEKGKVQLRFLDLFHTGQTVTNAVVQGLTFSDAQTWNVQVQNTGNLTLLDCIFRDNSNEKVFFISQSSDDGLSTFDVRVTISGCVFTDNVIWSYSGATVWGLVSILGGVVEILDSVFIRTTVDSNETTVPEYAILNQLGDLTLSNTCFLDNDDRIAPVVNLGGKLQLQSNNVQRHSATLPPTECAFVSHGDSGTWSALNETTFECEAPDSNVCTATTNQKVKSSCFQTLGEIYKLEEWVSVETDVPTRTYRLCPEMDYHIRSFDSFDGDEGDQSKSYPLILGLSNVHILCGHDGRSSNACTLTGGTYQLGIYDEYRVGEPFHNMLVQGLTFTMASSTNVRAVTNNDVTFADCVFKNNANEAVVLLDLSETEVGRFFAYRGRATRGLSDGQDLTLTMTIRDSLFADNSLSSSSGQSSGLITSHRGNIRLQHNTFYGTKVAADSSVSTLDEAALQYIKYVVANVEGTLELTGNCFVDNEATIAPVLSYKGTGSVYENGGVASSSVSSSSERGDTCQFLATVQGDDSTQYDHTALTVDSSFSCTLFDVSGCAIVNASAAEVDVPRGIPINATRIPVATSASPASPLTRPGSRTAIFCAVALVTALVVAGVVLALSQQVRSGLPRRRRTPSQFRPPANDEGEPPSFT